jgi:hypothetical protein
MHSVAAEGSSQVPPSGALNLDHVASFVPDREACHRALVALGFAPAPFSLQYHRLSPKADLTPAGTGNHCVMLRHGYLEYLVPVGDTPVAAQLRASIDRYVGVHSIVFGSGAARADHDRLQAGGFSPLPAIDLQRPIDTPDGPATARFTVVRVAPGAMEEGRIQFCQHHTENLVWQERWMTHPNAAIGLRAVMVCVDDVDSAVERYARFTGLAYHVSGGTRMFRLQRGRLEFYDASSFAARFGADVPQRPWIAGCEVASSDLGATRACLADRGLPVRALSDGRIAVAGPEAIGGVYVFTGT